MLELPFFHSHERVSFVVVLVVAIPGPGSARDSCIARCSYVHLYTAYYGYDV